tara:strand:- start:144 stop:1196 length:1053 start_codon:yes stop_codon:yes gene_type:complete
MKYNKLGKTDISVSSICLGTMTWGEQNSEKDSYQQMDYALDSGINFFDTAELYAIPPRPETAGLTEEYIGNWFKKRGKRDKVVLATKVAGRSEMTWLRNKEKETRLNKKQIHYALENSLKRLKTDYIDLYQIHWPDRSLNLWRDINYQHKEEEDNIDLEETLSILEDLIKEGKIRNIGVSNETTWGVMQYLFVSNTKRYTRICAIQNAYNLLNRTYEIKGGLSETAFREQVGLLAYSPLAQGYLTGKYLNGTTPEKSRKGLFKNMVQRYETPQSNNAVKAYIQVAKKYNVEPAQLAIRFCETRPFVTSTIIGATTMEQLKTNIESTNLSLSEEILKEIDGIHNLYSNPCP